MIMKKILLLLFAALPLVFGSCSPEDETPKGADWVLTCKFKLKMADTDKPTWENYSAVNYVGLVDLKKNNLKEGEFSIGYISYSLYSGLVFCDKDGYAIKTGSNTYWEPDVVKKVKQLEENGEYKLELDRFTTYQHQNDLSRSGRFMLVVYTMKTLFYTYIDIKDTDTTIEKEYTLVQKDSDGDGKPDTHIKF